MASQKILDQKQTVIDEIKERAQSAKSIVLFDYRGITDSESKELRTKLREAVQFIQTYCATHQGNCKDCLFSCNDKHGCPLAQLPEDWNTDCLM